MANSYVLGHLIPVISNTLAHFQNKNQLTCCNLVKKIDLRKSKTYQFKPLNKLQIKYQYTSTFLKTMPSFS